MSLSYSTTSLDPNRNLCLGILSSSYGFALTLWFLDQSSINLDWFSLFISLTSLGPTDLKLMNFPLPSTENEILKNNNVFGFFTWCQCYETKWKDVENYHYCSKLQFEFYSSFIYSQNDLETLVQSVQEERVNTIKNQFLCVISSTVTVISLSQVLFCWKWLHFINSKYCQAS